MALNSSGPISLGGTTAGVSIEVELGGSGTTQISLNDTNVRALAGVPSGAIIMPTNFYGKSSGFYFFSYVTNSIWFYQGQGAVNNAGDIYLIGQFADGKNVTDFYMIRCIGSTGAFSVAYSFTDNSYNSISARFFSTIGNYGNTAYVVGSFQYIATLVFDITGVPSFTRGYNPSGISNTPYNGGLVDSAGNFYSYGSSNVALYKTNSTSSASIYGLYVSQTGWMHWISDSSNYIYGIRPNGSTGVTIVGVDNTGTKLWAYTYSAFSTGSNYSQFSALAVDNTNGYLYATGTDGNNLIITQLNKSTGGVIWTKRLSGGVYTYTAGVSCTVDSSGNVYVFGAASSGNMSVNSGGAILVKYNSSGTIQWQRIIYGLNGSGSAIYVIDNASSNYWANSLKIDSSGILCLAWFAGIGGCVMKYPTSGSLTGSYSSSGTYSTSITIATNTGTDASISNSITSNSIGIYSTGAGSASSGHSFLSAGPVSESYGTVQIK